MKERQSLRYRNSLLRAISIGGATFRGHGFQGVPQIQWLPKITTSATLRNEAVGIVSFQVYLTNVSYEHFRAISSPQRS
jgi:hypothetical protein